MKSIFVFLLTSLLLLSCRKYEKPFISFKSPEKRITNTWVQEKHFDTNNVEGVYDEIITFTITGEDSIFSRTLNGSILNGKWSWMPALKDKVDKERIRVTCPGYNKVLTIKVLTNNNLEFIDQTSNYRFCYKKN